MLGGPLPINQEVMNFQVISNSGSSNSQDHWGFCLSTCSWEVYNKDLEKRECYIVGIGKNA